jgi:hypothetical protein
MKPQTCLRLTLLTPYLLWVVLAWTVILLNRSSQSMDPGIIYNVFLTAANLYSIGIVIWILPYTILAISLWMWSKGKSPEETARFFAFSPLIMAILVALEMGLLSMGWGGDGVSSDFGAAVVAIGGLAILFGYLIIGMVAGMYKILSVLHVIQ